MNAAPCSCRTTTCVIFALSSRARPRANVSSPGSAKTWRTPSFSRHATTSCATFTVASLFGARDLRRLGRGSDPDGLDVHELADPEARELAAVAAPLDAAERQAWVRGDHPVDEHGARFDPSREGPAALHVAGPQGRAEAIWRAIRDADGLVGVTHRHERRHRPEGLLREHGHVLGHVGEERGLVEPALAGDALPTDHDARALLHRPGDLLLQRVAQ